MLCHLHHCNKMLAYYVCLRLKAVVVVTMKITVFRDVMPRSWYIIIILSFLQLASLPGSYNLYSFIILSFASSFLTYTLPCGSASMSV
jgi:hypothetical protein